MNLDTELKNFAFRVGSEVANLAKTKTAPIKTGNLKKDIRVINVSSKSVTIGNTLKASYAKFVHFGTGVYGPKKAKIRPKKARALKTPYGFKKSIKGQKANPYLENAFNEYVKSGLKRAANSLAKEIGKKVAGDIKVTLNKS